MKQAPSKKVLAQPRTLHSEANEPRALYIHWQWHFKNVFTIKKKTGRRRKSKRKRTHVRDEETKGSGGDNAL